MWVGAIMVLVPAALSLLAPWLAPYDPNQVDLTRRLLPPSGEHWFGTDEVGRDLFSRVLDGGRRSIGAGLGVVLLSGFTGVVLGGLSGWRGGKFDLVLMRLMDVVLAFPALVLAMALAAALGPGLLSSVLAVAFVRVPVYVRLVRAQVLSLREREFVAAALTAGASTGHVLRRHLIPNSLPAVLVQATLDAGSAMLLTATLSFLGLGVRAPAAEWGAMVNSGRVYLLDQWWYSTLPGAAILLTAAGFNLLGDGLRDRLDPRQALGLFEAGRSRRAVTLPARKGPSSHQDR
ncbi:MAG: ABC transporter permease subunit [Firmicutes bacterium]|nr:ABC transporter permease subunit [Bacillota bacterium]